MATIVKPFTFSAGATIIASEHNSNFDTIYNEFNGNIDNDNIKSSAAIAASKLNLATIAQNIALSSAILRTAKGADVASSSSITLGDDGNYFDITGTSSITTIVAKAAGTEVSLQFDAAAQLRDGSNLKLGRDLIAAADTTIGLLSDGTNWFERGRSPTYKVKVGNFTRDMTAATGSVSYTGVGFKPSILFVVGIVDGGVGSSWGFTDFTSQVVNYRDSGGANYTTAAARFIDIQTGSGAGQAGALGTADDDGFTISWTKSGSPTGTGQLIYAAIGN